MRRREVVVCQPTAELHGPQCGLRRRPEAACPKVEHRPACLAAGGSRQGRFVGRREAQPSGRSAQRASWTDSAHLFERSERSERSELCGATQGRASQRSRRSRPPHHEPLPAAACREARSLRAKRTIATSRIGPQSATQRPAVD